MAQNKPQEAARAYKQALDNMPARAPNQAFLTAKYENVTGAVDHEQ